MPLYKSRGYTLHALKRKKMAAVPKHLFWVQIQAWNCRSGSGIFLFCQGVKGPAIGEGLGSSKPMIQQTDRHDHFLEGQIDLEHL